MSYDGADRCGLIGGGVVNSVRFIIYIYSVRHMDVLVANMGAW